MPNWDISFRFLNINTFEKNIALQNFEKSSFTLVWKSYVHVQAHKNLQLSLQAWVLKHRYCKCANLHWYCFSVFQPIGGTDSKTTFICSTLQMEGQSAWGWRKSGKHVRTSENVVMKLSRERLLCQTVQWQHNRGVGVGGGVPFEKLLAIRSTVTALMLFPPFPDSASARRILGVVFFTWIILHTT